MRSVVAAGVAVTVLAAGTVSTSGAELNVTPIPVDAGDAPRRAMLGDWIDLERQRIHHEGELIRLSHPLPGRVLGLDAKAVSDGYLMALTPERVADDSELTLVLIRFDGGHQVVADDIGTDFLNSWTVDSTKSRVAYARQSPDGTSKLVVADLPGGEVTNELAVPGVINRIFAFEGSTVWMTRMPTAGSTPAAWTWDSATQALTRLPRRLRFAGTINFSAGAVAGPKGRVWKVAPIDPRARWSPWTLEAGHVTFAPDGKHLVAVGRNYEETYPVTAAVKRVKSGRTVSNYLGPIWGPVIWQNAEDMLVRVYKNTARYAWLRLSTQGSVSRVTRFVERLESSIVPVQP